MASFPALQKLTHMCTIYMFHKQRVHQPCQQNHRRLNEEMQAIELATNTDDI